MSEQAPVRGLDTRSTTGSFATTDDARGPESQEPRSQDLRAEIERLQQELTRAERKASAAEERLTWLQDIGDAMSRRVRPEDAMQRILERVLRMVGAQHGTLYLAEEDGQTLVSRVMQGGALREIRLALGEGLAGHCARTQRAVNVKDAHRDPRFNDAIDRVTGVRTRAVLCVPMRDRRGRLLGVVQVLNKRDGTYFSLDDELMLGSVAISIGILVENFRFYLEEIVRNIELNEIREKLEERVRDLDALFELQRALSVAEDQDEELESVARTALTLLPSQACVITLVDEGEIESWVWRPGASRPTLVNGAGPVDRSPSRAAIGGGATPADAPERRAAERRLQHLERGCDGGHRAVINGCSPIRQSTVLITDQALFHDLELEPQSYLAVPVRVDARCVGSVELLNRRGAREDGRPPRFTDDDTKLLMLIAGQIGRALLASRVRRRRERDERIAAIGSMLSGILHDLKTPLTIASGYVQLIERSNDPARRRELGAAVRRQFADIQDMTSEVVAYARGEVRIFERTVHLTVFAADLDEWLRHEFEDTGISSRVALACRGDLRLDEGKLKRIIFNLARNAREAMKDEGRFEVHIHREADQLCVRCVDTGGGIAEPVQRRMFDAFVSAGKERRSGLGLAIVKKLTDELSGTITFRTVLGEGTEFSIRVPWRDAAEADEEGDDETPRAVATGAVATGAVATGAVATGGADASPPALPAPPLAGDAR